MSWQEISLNISSNQIMQEKMDKKNNELFDSIKNNEIKDFFDLVEGGANVNCIVNNETPLIIAMNHDNLDIFNLLLKLNANVNIKINDYPIIWQSLWENKIDFFKLIASHANKNDKEKKTGKTILMEAVAYSNLEAVKSLIMSGANINNKDNVGNTALHYAVSKNNFSKNDQEIIKLLIDAGANVLSENIYGNTPEDLIKNKSTIEQEQKEELKETKDYKNNYKNKSKKNNKFKKYTP